MILADSPCLFSWIKTRDPRMFAPVELRRKRNRHAAEVIFILDDEFCFFSEGLNEDKNSDVMV
jgi:hypothetical protein